MEKKKMKLWGKIIITILLTILLILIIHTSRNMIIISSIRNKINEYSKTTTNIYTKTSAENAVITSRERYYKDDVMKEIIIVEDKNFKMTRFMYSNQMKIFVETPEIKTLGIYESMTRLVFDNAINYSIFPELFIMGLTSMIRNDNIDGKDCYVLTNNLVPNSLYTTDGTDFEIYVEKETGLTMQTIETINENGRESIRTMKYEYSFGTVTDEDMKEPDHSEYERIN